MGTRKIRSKTANDESGEIALLVLVGWAHWVGAFGTLITLW